MRSLFLTATIIASIIVAACSQPDSGAEISGAMILEMNPSGRAPLAGVTRFTTNQPARSTVVISDGENSSTVPTSESFATEHEVMLLGFRPDRTHTISITLESENGGIDAMPATTFSVQTPKLTVDTPSVELAVTRPELMEPGLTFVPMFRWVDQAIDQTYAQMIILDENGEIVWQYEAPHGLYEVKRLENGNLLYMSFGWFMAEIDMLGNVVNEWHPAKGVQDPTPDSIAVDTDTFHHDVWVMPSGNLLALSTELREIDDWPTSETDPAAPRETQDVIGDVLVEFQRDGTVVNEWKFFDLIDPYRIGYGSLGRGFYEGVYDELAPDWTHNNGIFYDEDSHTALISTNHLSTVMNLDLETGELLWMLGDPGNWREPWSDLLLEPEGELEWSYHHHSPKWTPNGTLLLFDNGAVRALPPNPPMAADEAYSRAVEYEIDAANGTVRQVWSYGGPGDDIFLSAYISEADWLPETENILVTSGGRVRDDDGNVLMFPEEGHNWISLTELTHTLPAEKVWEVIIDNPGDGWAAFRTDRIPSLFW